MILIAPDKFKGTFSAQEICQIVFQRLRRSGVEQPIVSRPLSDGGEGIATVLLPDARKIAPGVYEKDGCRLVVSSEIVGFDAFNDKDIPLMQRSSFLLGKAIAPGIPTLIAVGGTAVADGGAGFLQGLGAKFFDSDNRLISQHLSPSTLSSVCSADLSCLQKYQLEGIIDVRASLTRRSPDKLSSIDFATQKASPGENIDGLNDALAHLHNVLGGESPWDGAGGGLGYAIASVCRAKCFSGADFIVSSLDVDWKNISLVITGEGKVDSQTVKGGKVVDAVYRKASSHGIPTLILYGRAEDNLPYPNIAPLTSPWEPTALALLNH